MKLGCIFKTTAIVVVVVGIGYYIAKRYGNEIVESSKDKIEVFFMERVQNTIDQMSESVLKDSLKSSFNDIVKEIDFEKINISSEQYDQLAEKLSEFVDSNKVNQETLQELKDIIKDYER